jgi:magnesium transporter
MPTASLVFDRDRVDDVDDWSERIDTIARTEILWIDLDRPDEDDVAKLTQRLELNAESSKRLGASEARPAFSDYASYVHVSLFAPSRDDTSATPERIECLVSERWIVTAHDHPVAVLDTFRERVEGSGETGELDGLEFLADLVEWVLDGYLAAFEEVEGALEEFDSRAMDGQLDETETELRQIGRLRRALVSHREVFLALARPELQAITSSRSADRFTALRDRLEDVVQSARDARDSVVGSFDVLIARNEHRTNEIMKVLTLASLLLLPGSLIAGVLGMNFKLGIFEHKEFFWVVLGIIGGLAVATLTLARSRRWI